MQTPETPPELTPEMLAAGVDVLMFYTTEFFDPPGQIVAEIYRAMRAAELAS